MKRQHPERPILIGVWLIAVFGVLQWKYPGFWHGPDAHFRAAEAHVAAGRAADALTEVEAALRAVPESSQYLRFKGYRELELGRPEAAAESFASAVLTEPDDLEGRFGLATALVDARTDLDSARAVLQALSADAGGPGQRARLARLFAGLPDPDAALTEFEGALASRPTDPVLLREASDLALALGRWDRVIELTDRWLLEASTPSDRGQALTRRAPALRASGRIDEAFDSYAAIADSANLPQRAALALETEHYPEAAGLYRDLRQRESDEGTERALAYALERAGQLSAADSTYRRLLTSPEVAQETRIRYAWLLNVLGRYGEAWTILEPLGRPASDPALLALQAQTAVWARLDEEAIRLLRVWVERPRPSSLLAARVAHEHLAAMLDENGRAGEALLEYRWLAERQPQDAAVWIDIARISDQLGRPADVEEAWERALGAGAEHPEGILRLARLRRDRGALESAIQAFDDYLGRVDDREVAWELTTTLMNADRPVAALALIRESPGEELVDPAHLEIAVWAAWSADEPGAAAGYLKRLAELRPLEGAERVQLADALRGSGDSIAALEEYERLAGEGALAVWETVGDLRAQLDQHPEAAEAYDRVPPGPRTAEVERKRAGALMRAGATDEALAAYRRALLADPPSASVEIEFARAAASAGRPDTAVSHYLAVVEMAGAEGIRLELAQNLLAARRFSEAERWARDALLAGEPPDESRLALGESLQAQGRSEEAEETLRPLVRSGHGAGDLAWQARVAAARDRHLEAWRLYGRAIEAAPGTTSDALLAELWVARARSAVAMGDFRRADEAFQRAIAAGAGRDAVVERRRSLAEATRPQVELPASLFRDDNDLEFRDLRLGGRIWSGASTLNGELGFGRLEQGPVGFDRWTAGLDFEDWRPAPSVALSARVGVEDYGDGGSLWVGDASLRVLGGDGSFWGVDLQRGTPWSGFRDRDPRRFNRIIDLAAIGPDFDIFEGRAIVDRVVGGRDRRLRLEGGLADYADGNLQGSLYGHYQVPLHGAVGAWTVLRPNLYVEFFDDRVDSYFSPEALVSLGLGFHGIRGGPGSRFEFEIQPEIRWAQGGGVDPGLFALGEGTFSIADALDLRFGAFGYAQGDGYWLIRPFLSATATLGPRDVWRP